MKIRDRCTRSGLIGALIVVWLLAGVFAMHGLTGNHEVALALNQGVHPAGAIMPPNVQQTVPQPSLHTAADQMPPADLPVVAAAPAAATIAATPLSGVQVEITPAGHRHATGDVCLAMLTVLALAILGALASRSLRATRPVARLSPALRSIVWGPPPPWAQPTLSKLCVLRS